jgi:hypothetical protein
MEVGRISLPLAADGAFRKEAYVRVIPICLAALRSFSGGLVQRPAFEICCPQDLIYHLGKFWIVMALRRMNISEFLISAKLT